MLTTLNILSQVDVWLVQIVMTGFFAGRDSLTAFVTCKTHKEARLALKLLNNQVLKGIILLG